tara:strand:+ start:1748 stop:2377 length:630 start_codon:yes stop_codon:yes gene_type:complete
MADKKTLTTPVGTAQYPRLNTPDTTFNENGEYRCNLIVSEKEAAAFKKQLQPLYDEAYQKECTLKGKPDLKKTDAFPIKQNDEGQWIIKAKQKAKVVTRDGKPIDLKVGLFDSQGKPHPADEIIGGGSKLKLAVRPHFWFVQAVGGFGVTLQLVAAQIIELNEYQQGESSAQAFGFTAVEGGYVHGGETFEESLNEKSEEQEELLEANF